MPTWCRVSGNSAPPTSGIAMPNPYEIWHSHAYSHAYRVHVNPLGILECCLVSYSKLLCLEELKHARLGNYSIQHQLCSSWSLTWCSYMILSVLHYREVFSIQWTGRWFVWAGCSGCCQPEVLSLCIACKLLLCMFINTALKDALPCVPGQISPRCQTPQIS